MNQADEQVCFYAEIGFAFTQWGNVEHGLRHVVTACIHGDDHNAVSLGFFSIENFRSKLEFANKVVLRQITSNRLASEWAKLVDKARASSARRNKLAHGKVSFYPTAKAGRRYALEAWIFKKSDRRKTGGLKPLPGALCVRDIVAIRHEFAAVTTALGNFSYRVRGLQEPLPKADEQAKNPPTLQMIRRQILGAPAPRPAPSRA